MSAFENATIQSITIQPQNADAYINEAAFRNCIDLKTVDYSSKDETTFIGQITIGKEAFSSCLKLESFKLPHSTSVTTNIDEYAFAHCVNLNTVAIPAVLNLCSYVF